MVGLCVGFVQLGNETGRDPLLVLYSPAVRVLRLHEDDGIAPGLQ